MARTSADGHVFKSVVIVGKVSAVIGSQYKYGDVYNIKEFVLKLDSHGKHTKLTDATAE